MMAYKMFTLTLLVLMLVGVLSSACAQVQQDHSPADGAKDDRRQDTTEQGNATQQERTPSRYPKAVLTGIITKRGEGLFLFRKKPGSWILLEEDPDAGCRSNKAPMGPCSPKMYFDITRKSDVYEQQGNALTKVSATRLKKGQKVRADYTGYDVAESYPGQTDARKVVIRKTD